MVDVVKVYFQELRGKDDATIALSARTLYIASESDTSVQSIRITGKSEPSNAPA
jgi:hypothetical protein